MIFLNEEIKKLLTAAVKKKFPKADTEIKVEYPVEAVHGDYSAATAFQLAKEFKKPSQEVAQEILDAIKKPDWISKIELAGPGFINFFLAPEFLTEFLVQIKSGAAKFGASRVFEGKTIVTDISHPNVAKPMGAHHLLSTIIGDALNRIFAAAGYKVIRDSYIGDWGTQFGKLIYAYHTWGDEKAVRANPIPELLKLYVKFHDEAEKSAALEDKGRAEFKKLEDGDKENRKLWKWIVDLSLQEFEKIYKRLNVKFDVINGESFYEDKMQAIIDMGKKKGIFVKGEKGALIAPFKHQKYPPCIIQKSDGATLYATRDLARIKYWEDTWHPDAMINVVDNAQSLYFQQLFEVAKMLGLTRAPNIHVSFGRMRFPEKRMSTRKGNIILLEELLDEAEEKAYKIVCEKNPDLSEKDKREVARKVGIGAVKYAVLGQNRTTDVTFTWDKILSLEGNSAPYLQYVYARARSILRKSEIPKQFLQNATGQANSKSQILNPKNAPQIPNIKQAVFTESAELELARMLPKFPEVVVLASQEFKPNLIANYLFNLARKFNSFYTELPVLKAEPAIRAARLLLVEAASITLKRGLELLGIEAPEEM